MDFDAILRKNKREEIEYGLSSRPLYVNRLLAGLAAAFLFVVLFYLNLRSFLPFYLAALSGGVLIAFFLRLSVQTQPISAKSAASISLLGTLVGIIILGVLADVHISRTWDGGGMIDLGSIVMLIVIALGYQPIQIYLVLITATTFITMYVSRISKRKRKVNYD